MRDRPSKPSPARKKVSAARNATPRASGYAARRRPRKKSPSPIPYIIGGAALIGVIVLLGGGLFNPTARDGTPPTPTSNETKNNKLIAGGFPSEAEDLYREGHNLLDRAMSAPQGIDPTTLKAAIKKLDAAAKGYRKLKEEHPGEPRINARLKLINKLRYRAKKSAPI